MALTTAITIAGNVTYDPELRQTREGKAVVNLTVAVNPRAYDQATKEWKDGEPVFYKASAFANLAEHIAGSISKGNRVILHGNMKTNKWADKDSGIEKSENVIMIDDIGLSLQFTNAQVVRQAPNSQGAGSSGGDSWNSGFGDDTPF